MLQPWAKTYSITRLERADSPSETPALDSDAVAWLGSVVSKLSNRTLDPGQLVAVAIVALLPVVAEAQSSDRRSALNILQELEASVPSRQTSAQLIARARHALARAQGARDAGDHRHATELEALALELSETGRDLSHAIRTEREVAELSRRATLAETRAIRAQAMVEQTAARRGRAAAQLDLLERERATASAVKPTTSMAKPLRTLPAAQGKQAPKRQEPSR